MYPYKATVRLANGFTQNVVVQADTVNNAKLMLEAQYGVGSIQMGPVRV